MSKHQRTFEQIMRQPASGNVKWRDVESLLKHMGARFEEGRGSRVHVYLFDVVKAFHRSHPSPMIDKGALADVRDWFKENNVKGVK